MKECKQQLYNAKCNYPSFSGDKVSRSQARAHPTLELTNSALIMWQERPLAKKDSFAAPNHNHWIIRETEHTSH